MKLIDTAKKNREEIYTYPAWQLVRMCVSPDNRKPRNYNQLHKYEIDVLLGFISYCDILQKSMFYVTENVIFKKI